MAHNQSSFTLSKTERRVTMTKEVDEPPLVKARRGSYWLAKYLTSSIEPCQTVPITPIFKADILALCAEFERLDKIEQGQIEAGKLGAKFGAMGGRPRKKAKKAGTHGK